MLLKHGSTLGEELRLWICVHLLALIVWILPRNHEGRIWLVYLGPLISKLKQVAKSQLQAHYKS